jgi:hypothetical protein
MYNPGTQVQIPADANLGSYYLLKNSLWGSPPPLSFQKKNVSFKFIMKFLVNRLTRVINSVILLNQTAFIQGRYILEGVNVLHEVMNSMHKNKKAGVLFKIDFEKAFDKIKWPFLVKTMEMKGFPTECINLIMKTVTSGKVGINVNGEIGPYFCTHQGLRQGDPMSPLLFDTTVDVLAILIKRAQEEGLIKGLASDLTAGGVSILQYADDTILLLENNCEQARNLKIILCLFEQMSDLKINFHKSDIYCLGQAQANVAAFEEIFTCKVGKLPMKYLGVPIDKKRIRLSNWKPTVEKNGEQIMSMARENAGDGRKGDFDQLFPLQCSLIQAFLL